VKFDANVFAKMIIFEKTFAKMIIFGKNNFLQASSQFFGRTFCEKEKFYRE
jgi:hypothetical protein